MAHWRASSKGLRWTLPVALKVSLLFASLLSLVHLASCRLSLPNHVSSLIHLSAALPSACLTPPYLFITVHFIILLIWKLSDSNQPKHHQHKQLVMPSPPAQPAAPALVQVEQTLPKHTSLSLSDDNGSCTTDDKSDHNSTASSSHLGMRRSEPVAGQEEQPAAPAVEEGEMEADDSMDATWKAIMAKASRPVVTSTSRAVEAEISAGADDMNQRFEEFIKKSRDQMGLEVGEAKRHGGRYATAN